MFYDIKISILKEHNLFTTFIPKKKKFMQFIICNYIPNPIMLQAPEIWTCISPLLSCLIFSIGSFSVKNSLLILYWFTPFPLICLFKSHSNYSKIKHKTSIWSNNPTSGYSSKRIKIKMLKEIPAFPHSLQQCSQ